MSDSDNSGCLMGLIWVITIGISIGSGILAWNWIDPDSFFGGLAFLIVWALFSRIGHFIALAIVAIMGGMD
jgi:hypothetical protein